MNDVSLVRLYLLRATYLLIAVGLAVSIWPGVIAPPSELDHSRTVIRSLLAGVSLVALLGVRYPLQLLPLLLFELVWKSVWLLAFGVRRWATPSFDGAMQQTGRELLISVVLFAAVIPWAYVWRRYVRFPGDRWSRRSATSARDAT